MLPHQIKPITAQIDTRVSEIEYEAALDATKTAGIETVVEFARDEGLKQGIYTFNTHRNAEASLRHAGLLEYFDTIVGRDDVENPKPHKEHLITLCRKLGVAPRDIVVIGDTYRDIQGAKKVGAKSIAIRTKTSGFSNEEIFASADIIIDQNEISDKLIPAIKTFYTK